MSLAVPGKAELPRPGTQPILKDTLSLSRGIEKLHVNKQVEKLSRQNRTLPFFNATMVVFWLREFKKPTIAQKTSAGDFRPRSNRSLLPNQTSYKQHHSCTCQEKGYCIHTTEVPSVSLHDTGTRKHKVSKNDRLHRRRKLCQEKEALMRGNIQK